MAKVQFVDVTALVVLRHVMMRFASAQNLYAAWPTKRSAREYLRDQLQVKSSTKGVVLRARPNRFAIRWVASERQMAKELGKWGEMLVSSGFATDEEARSYVMLMGEVLTNSFSHGKTAKPVVLGGQTFPKKGHSLLAAADHGLTIPKTLRDCGHYPDSGEADEYWVKRSLELGVTAGTRPSNMGIGLYALSEKVKQNGGTLTLVSGGGLVELSPAGARLKVEPLGKKYGKFPGTMIVLDLRRRA